MTRRKRIPVRWRADGHDRDLVGHAYPPRGFRPALCGAVPFDERWASPSAIRCQTCLELSGEAPIAVR